MSMRHCRTSRRIGAATASAFLIACTSALALPTWSSFVLQARSAPDAQGPGGFNLPAGTSLYGNSVALDADGTVAILVLREDDEGVFVGREGAGSLVFSTTDAYASSIDVRGGLMAVAFQSAVPGGAEFRSIASGAALVRAFPAGGTEGVSILRGLHILDDHTMAYRSTNLAQNVDKLIIDSIDTTSGGRTQQLIAQTGSTYQFIFDPAVNDSRQVAAVVNISPSVSQVVRFEPSGQATVLAATGSGATWSGLSSNVAINASGQVAFYAQRSSDTVYELLVADGSANPPRRIAQVGQLGIIDLGFGDTPPSINAGGLVAFRARDAAGDALFVGDGTELVRVVGDLSTLPTDLGPRPLGYDFDLTGREALSGGVAINDSNQLAFAGILDNGQIGVYVASGTTTPVCPADLDDDGQPSTGLNPDGAVTIEDLIAFLVLFEDGDVGGDLDDGTQTGAHDGAVTIDDLIFFLIRFENGC